MTDNLEARAHALLAILWQETLVKSEVALIVAFGREERRRVWVQTANYIEAFAQNKSESRKGSPFLIQSTVQMLFRLAEEIQQQAQEEA